jgi:AraC-like DNA-binding protein
MGLMFWDGSLRGAAAALLLLLAINFGRDWRTSQTAKLGVALTVAGICYLTLPLIPKRFEPSWWSVPPHLISLAAPAIFWLFAASWFDDDFELRPVHGVAVIGLVIAGTTGNYFAYTYRNLFLAAAWRLGSLAFVALGIRVALMGRNADLVEGRRRIRLALSIAIALLIIWIVASELSIRGWPPPLGWRVGNGLAVLLLAATVAFSLLGWRDPALLVPPAKPVASAPEADDSALLARLAAEMTRERLYRQDGLTITAVAARLGVPEYRLRRAINQGLGARNFNAYLNDFRLAEAREALADASQRDVPILTIALDAGFGSLAPFNRAFRAASGCTPTEYRAKMRSG